MKPAPVSAPVTEECASYAKRASEILAATSGSAGTSSDETLRRLMGGAFGRGRRFSFEEGAELLGMKERHLRAIADGEQRAGLNQGLSIAGLIGPAAVNALLASVGYLGAKPAEAAAAASPFETLGGKGKGLACLSTALSDGRIDHVERAGVIAMAQALARELEALAASLEARNG
jgi:hypothetical protein